MTDGGKRVLVVGASSGIGLACATNLADAGLTVISASRTRGELPESIRHETVDVLDEESVARLAQVLSEDCAPLHGIVYAAGQAAPAKPVDAFDAEEFDRLVGINVRGALLVLKHMRPGLRSGARVVWIGSLASRQGSALSNVSYTASKAALAGAARQLAIELAPEGVALNVVHPGMTLTPMLERALAELPADEHPTPPPSGRFARPDDVASVVRFLVLDAPDQLVGAGIDVNGGVYRGV